MRRSREIIHIRFHKRCASYALGLLALLLRLWRAITTRAQKRALIIEPFGLGDAISHEPLLRALGRSGFSVTFCTRPEWRAAFADLDFVEVAAPWGRHAKGAKYKLADYWGEEFRRLLRDLRGRGRGAVGIDTRGDVRSVLLLYAAGCKRVISLQTYLGTDLRMLPGSATRVPFDRALRRWELNLRFLDPLGVQASGAEPPSIQRKHFENQFSRRVALNPIAPWKGKWWPAQNWIALIAGLKERDFEPTVFCGPAQRVLVETELGNETPVIQCSSVSDWIEQLQTFSTLVTLDSGPMHLADALGIPVVALFGQGALPLWAPSGTRSCVIAHQDSDDFELRNPSEENTEFAQQFMRRIHVDEVLAAVERIAAPRPDHC